MGKKRKFNRFIRWIKSDLPEDNKSVLLLGVTKIPSPTPVPRARPHTLHLDHHLATKSQTLESYPRLKPRLFRSHSKDSLNELLAYNRTEVNFNAHNYVPVHEHTSGAVNLQSKLKSDNNHGTTATARPVAPLTVTATDVKVSDTKFAKKVSFNCNTLNGTDQLNVAAAACFQNGTAASKRLGFCTDLPYDFYHPDFNETSDEATSVPDIIMDKSMDSIGSCSLDVDASSTDFSDSSVGSTDCTLRSLGIPSPTVQQSHTVPSFRLEPSTTIFDAVEPKKPSYLNLACTVNGYSNITNYDSKLRENFRISKSRDVSPIRPQDYHASRDQNGEPSKFLTPNYTKPLLISPPAPNMADSKSQTIYRSSQNSSYSYSSSSTRTMTFMSKETRNFASSMLYNAESDTVDNAANFNPKTNGVQTKFSSFESSKVSQNAYTNVNGKASSMSETSIQENYSNGQQAKSFIQQRVERLYGPGALAQGFFISKRTKNRLSDSENTEATINGTVESSPPQVQQQDHDTSLENDSSIKQNSSSPSLPVLRHLRPEFRAQLPILSPKRLYNDNIMQKSTTVPSSLTTVATSNGIEENKLLLNGSKTTESITENKENIAELVIDDKLSSKQQQQIPVKLDDLNSVTIITEEIPAAPQVILPVVNGSADVVNGSDVNRNIPKKPEVRDGHYFLKILKNETDRLISLAEKVEAELEEKKTVLADDVLGYLRSASGKARLLASQKMQQFEGLCHKNINQVAGEPFPTTTEDLQGFWDMVMLQVTQIDELFAELEELKANNWVIQEKPIPDVTDSTSKPKKLVVKKAVSANAEAQRKQREAARKQMIEAKRKAMRMKQSQQETEQGIEIFVPESS